MSDKNWKCLDCGAVTAVCEIPPHWTEDAVWAELAKGHSANCLWINTRGHEIAPSEPDDVDA